MKSALAAMIAAAGRLAAAADGRLKGDVILAFTAGESANLLGARRFVERGLKKEIGAFLCGEPSDLDVVIVEKAALWLRATATGRLGHVSGEAGVNAIELTHSFLTRLYEMKSYFRSIRFWTTRQFASGVFRVVQQSTLPRITAPWTSTFVCPRLRITLSWSLKSRT
ncbi:hypothetical protein AJ87_21025 [Rhizobium yanglingense]|nr:hypothetical protein AJ87_21025 [Rhizobium yanglingense]